MAETRRAGQRDRSNAVDLLRSPSFWLTVAVAAYAVTQFVMLDEGRFLEWDEAVYVGEASSRFPSPGWSEHRSGGILWIVKPVLLVSDSWVVLRVYLVAVSAGALGFAYSRWIRPGGWLAPTAMTVFAFSWLPIFYGSEVSPNLYVAAAAVGATGALVALVSGGRRLDFWLLGLFVAAAVFLRLSDGLVLAAGLGFVSVVVMRLRRAVRVLGVVAIGVGLGVLPWLAESMSRFGGPVERLRSASDIVGGGPTWNLMSHLNLLDGPLIGPDRVESVSRVVLVLLLVYAVVAGFGVVNTRGRPGPQIAFSVGLWLALPYFVYVEALAPRFLLPAMALLAISIAAGVLHLWRLGPLLGVGASVLLLCGMLWSIAVADRIESARYELRGTSREIAAAIVDSQAGDECEFIAQYGFPQIMVASGCGGARADLTGMTCQVRRIQERSASAEIFVALVSAPPKEVESYLVPVAASQLKAGWSLYVVDGESVPQCGAG